MGWSLATTAWPSWTSLLHLLAVEQVLHGQHEVRVLPRAAVAAHDQVGVLARLGLEDGIAGACQHALGCERGLTRRDQVHVADSSALTRADSSGMPT